MGLVRFPVLLAVQVTQHVLQDSKAAMRSAIARLAAGLRLCLATGRELTVLSVLQLAQRV